MYCDILVPLGGENLGIRLAGDLPRGAEGIPEDGVWLA